MGTLPIIFIFSENQFVVFSVNARNNIAGPSVMSKYKSEGGYFDTLRNERNVNVLVDCSLHGEGSPYTFDKRRIMNSAIIAVPNSIRNFLRFTGSYVSINFVPRQYPSAITPIHGMSG